MVVTLLFLLLYLGVCGVQPDCLRAVTSSLPVGGEADLPPVRHGRLQFQPRALPGLLTWQVGCSIFPR